MSVYIRRLLTETAVRAADRRVVYVGIEVYEAAGVVVMRDLFDEDDGGWFQDPANVAPTAPPRGRINTRNSFPRRSTGWRAATV